MAHSNLLFFVLLCFITFLKNCKCAEWKCGSESITCSKLIDHFPKEVAFSGICLNDYSLERSENFIKKNLNDIELTFYVDRCSASSLNITLKNVQWQEASLKYTIPKTKTRLFDEHYCISNASEIQGKTLYFDCPLTDPHEIQTALLEFEAWKGKSKMQKKYLFDIPRHEKLVSTIFEAKDLEIFMYIDITDDDTRKLFIEDVDKFNITKYNITLYKSYEDSRPEQMDFRIIERNKTYQNYLQIEYHIAKLPRNYDYYFKVEAIDNFNNTVCTSRSAIFRLVRYYTALWIWSTIILISLMILLIVLIYKHKITLSAGKNKIIFITDSRTQKELEFYKCLVKELRDIWHMNIFYDPTDVQKERDKDPINWLIKNYDNSSHVVFFNRANIKDESLKIYVDLYDRAINHYRCKKNSNQKIIKVYFPYTGKKFSNEICANTSIDLSKDLNKFLCMLSDDPRLYFIKMILIKKNAEFQTLDARIKREIYEIGKEVENKEPLEENQLDIMESEPILTKSSANDNTYQSSTSSETIDSKSINNNVDQDLEINLCKGEIRSLLFNVDQTESNPVPISEMLKSAGISPGISNEI